MATTNRELTSKARQSLSANWGLAVGAFFIFMMINSIGNEVSLIIGDAKYVGPGGKKGGSAKPAAA